MYTFRNERLFSIIRNERANDAGVGEQKTNTCNPHEYKGIDALKLEQVAPK